MVEMLIVIGVVITLVAVLGTTIGNMVESTRIKATRATIRKIHGLLEERIRAFDQEFFGPKFSQKYQTEIRTVSSRHAGVTSEALAEIILRKEKYRSLFAVPESQNTAANASEFLYVMLTQANVLGGTLVDEDTFTSSELADTDGDGKMEFVDSWGRPLRFYAWPTQAVRPQGIIVDPSGSNPPTLGVVRGELTSILMPGVTQATLEKDPEDPVGVFETWVLADPNRETSFHTPRTYHVPLIVSAGPDADVGLYEPWDRGNFGHLARPTQATMNAGIFESGVVDNITNYQGAGQ